MKKYYLLLIACLVFLSQASFAQNGKFTGKWQGVLSVNVDLTIVFNIKMDSRGNFSATADSPDQNAYEMRCDTVIINGDKVKIELRDLNAAFDGRLINDTTLDGIFSQGIELPLVLKKAGQPTEIKRPQNPIGPFPYKSEDISYNDKANTMHYGATITIPEGEGPFPAAILISGSGQQNRDEEIMGHKPFAVIADHLTRNGYLILRVDDRGVGKSTGKFETSTSADFAKDVNAGLDYLLTRKEVDKKKLGMIGHSEGGMIAPMVATERKDIDFIVLLAGPGVPIKELMVKQNVYILKSSGVSEAAIAAYIPLYSSIVEEIVVASDTAVASANIMKLVEDWRKATDTSYLKELGLHSDKEASKLGGLLLQAMSSSWYKYFLAFDPTPYLRKLNTKVLALNGENDIQVISKQNLPGIEAALKKSKSKVYTVKEMPGQNHLFQTCTKCTLDEYGQLEESFSPSTLKFITDWLNENVKK